MEHGNGTTMPCAKFQGDWTTDIDFMVELIFSRFDLMMGLLQEVPPN